MVATANHAVAVLLLVVSGLCVITITVGADDDEYLLCCK